jgi:(2Fe-2S) ferredoxin
METPPKDPGLDVLERAGVHRADRHVFVCIGPECCVPREGEMLWEYMKARIKQEKVTAMRTKAACLRVCAGGPWMVVYPEGVWYGEVTPERFERVLREHLIGGQPVGEWVAARNPLCGTPSNRLG